MFENIPGLTDKERKRLERNRKYWGKRAAETQSKLTEKNIAQTQEQLKKYYKQTMLDAIGQFEKTYNKILSRIGEDKTPTPADLYKLDTYWQMQAQLRNELQKLGDKQAALLSKQFMDEWEQIYKVLAIKDDLFFSEADTALANTMINEIWCADGLSWEERIWKNNAALQEELNQGLIECLVNGKKSGDLKQLLQEKFMVSYSRADSLVRTEMAHIQTQAAKQRYNDYGIAEVEILADKDERQCEVCGKLHKQRFPVNGNIPIPAHPRCRCCIVPVVDTEEPKQTERFGYKEDLQPQQQNLTLQNNNGIIQLDKHQQKAQDKVKELQQQGNLVVYDKEKESHKRHVRELLGVEQVDEAAWKEYERMATEFLKRDIDGDKMDGFISKDGWLFKFEKATGLFGLLSNKGTISTFFIPDKMTPEEYWKTQIEQFKPKE